MNTTLDNIMYPTTEEQVTKSDKRISQQMESGKEVFDVKIDLLQYMRQTVFVERNKQKIEHHFHFENITEQDALLLQVPNINESGYYAGIVAVKSYLDKYAPEFKVAIIDPVIDYFFLNPPDRQGEFFNLFNTYSKQSQFHLLYDHQETFDIAYGFIGRYIEKAKPKFLGFSIIDGNIDASLAIAKLIKGKYPELKIIFGGNGVECLEFGRLPNANYKIKDYDFIDVIVRGDGEMTFIDLLKCDWTETALMNIKGLVWRLNGQWIFNQMRPNMPLETLPVPDYSSLEDNYYYKSVYQDTIPLVMSRGCPYRCSFCSIVDFIPEYRYRTVDNVIEEIQGWIAKGKRHFFCHDSIINGNPVWLKKFCERIIELELDITWGGNMRLQTPMRDLDTMRLYRKAGLIKFITGFESASESVLRHMKKYTNREGTREIFENVRQINKENKGTKYDWPLKFGMQLIIGYLNEGEEDFQQTMDFIAEYHDVMDEIVTCSAFLIHEPLRIKWLEEGQYLEYINGVNFTTKWNTPMDRLDRLNRAEAFFKKINLPYSIYNRGLYQELKDEQTKKEEEQKAEELKRQQEAAIEQRKKADEEFFKLYPDLKVL